MDGAATLSTGSNLLALHSVFNCAVGLKAQCWFPSNLKVTTRSQKLTVPSHCWPEICDCMQFVIKLFTVLFGQTE